MSDAGDSDATDVGSDGDDGGLPNDGAAFLWVNVRASDQQHKRLRSGDMLRVKICVTSAELGSDGAAAEGERNSAATITSVLRGHTNELGSFFDLPPHVPVVNPTSIPAAVGLCAVVALAIIMVEITFAWRCLLSVLLAAAAAIELNGGMKRGEPGLSDPTPSRSGDGAMHAALLVDMRGLYWLYGKCCALAAPVGRLLGKSGLTAPLLSDTGASARVAASRAGGSLRVFYLQLMDWDWEEGGELGDSALLAEIDNPAAGTEIGDVLTRVPKRWLDMNNGNVALAEEWWAKTVQWRAETKIEEVLSRPQPHFDIIKEEYSHFITGRDKMGHPIYVDVIKSPNVQFRQLKRRGVTVDDVVDHMIFLNEWMWRRLLDDYDEVGSTPRKEAYLLKIVDMQGIGMADTWGDTYLYFQKLSALNKHYPERMFKTFVINVPSSFSFVWKLVAPMLDPNVREKVSIYKANEFQAPLLELVDADQLPERYGGTMVVPDDKPMYLSLPVEKQLRQDALGHKPSPKADGGMEEEKSGGGGGLASAAKAALQREDSGREW
mmetsp:Transcript_15415/g.27229  ORF Transcript_15415/g.27229 Transcript_15415/m.27229 type:complete len:549 (-) Transcript_15415:141-1787(-)